jgi:hypothetical protein
LCCFLSVVEGICHGLTAWIRRERAKLSVIDSCPERIDDTTTIAHMSGSRHWLSLPSVGGAGRNIVTRDDEEAVNRSDLFVSICLFWLLPWGPFRRP